MLLDEAKSAQSFKRVLTVTAIPISSSVVLKRRHRGLGRAGFVKGGGGGDEQKINATRTRNNRPLFPTISNSISSQ